MNKNAQILKDAQQLLDRARDMPNGPDSLLYAFAHMTTKIDNLRVLEALAGAQISLQRVATKLH